MPSPRIPKDDLDGVYFVTMTTIDWIDIFTNTDYFNLLKDTLQFSIDHKGLLLYEYVFMTNHIHLIVGKKQSGKHLSEIIGEFKSWTTNTMREMLVKDKRSYLQKLIQYSKSKKAGYEFQIWQQQNWPEYISSDTFRNEKIQYIWYNPVKKGYVAKPEDWLYGSAKQRLLNLPGKHPDVMIPCADWNGQDGT